MSIDHSSYGHKPTEVDKMVPHSKRSWFITSLTMVHARYSMELTMVNGRYSVHSYIVNYGQW